MNWNEFWNTIVAWLTTSGVKLLIGLVALFILFKLINSLAKGVKKGMIKKNVEKTIYTVTYQVIRKGLKIVVFLFFLNFVGIDTAGIGSVIASVGVAIGLALQGSLANLAGGMLIILLRPFKLGDYIEGQGLEGTVEEISIFYTHLVTFDGKAVMIPNGSLLNGNIINYSKQNLRRVDLPFSVCHGADIAKAEQVLREVLEGDELILKDPAPFVNINNIGDSSIEIITKSWTKNDDYWTVYYRLLENVKAAFDNNGIVIPYRQMDVHVDNLPNCQTLGESK